MNEVCVFYTEPSAPKVICDALLHACDGYDSVVFAFIGTDSNVGDSMAPMCGSMIYEKTPNIFIYGDLNSPVTAKEVPFLSYFLKSAHPESIIVAIDAAVGKREDVGNIKILKKGIKPGLGVNKNLPLTGDVSIIGVMCEKTSETLPFLGGERISKVFSMAKVISSGIRLFIEHLKITRNITA